MTHKLMTLAEALATKKPFKHKDWNAWSNKLEMLPIGITEMYLEIWEVQDEPEPPLRVWKNGAEMLLTREDPTKWNDGNDWKDCTADLAAALAPYLNGELK